MPAATRALSRDSSVEAFSNQGNFCWVHESLRLRAIGGRKWLERTPAMAAGLTDHVWTVEEVLRFPVPPRARTATTKPRRGRTRDQGRLLPFPARPAPPTGRAA